MSLISLIKIAGNKELLPEQPVGACDGAWKKEDSNEEVQAVGLKNNC